MPWTRGHENKRFIEVKAMGRETVLFTAEERKTTVDVAQFLRSLADRLEGGKVVLKGGQGDLELEIPSSVMLEVKVEEEVERSGRTKRSLEVEIEWSDSDQRHSGGIALG